MLFNVAWTFPLGFNLIKLYVEMGTRSLYKAQDECTQKPWNINTIEFYLRFLSAVIDQDRGCHILHDSLDQIKLVRCHNFAISIWVTISIYSGPEVSESLAQIIFCKALTHPAFLEIGDGEDLELSVGLSVLETEEHIVLVVIDELAVLVVFISDLYFLNSETGLKVEIIGFLSLLDDKDLTIGGKRGLFKEVDRVLSFDEGFEVFILVEENFFHEL